jgi:hypothetical protein
MALMGVIFAIPLVYTFLPVLVMSCRGRRRRDPPCRTRQKAGAYCAPARIGDDAA